MPDIAIGPLKNLNRRLFLSSGGAALAACAGLRTAPSAPLPGFDRTRALIASYVADGRVAGATVAVKLAEAPARYFNAGALSIGGAAADESTLYRIFSMSKPVTGVAAMILVGEGALSLDQPVADFIPEFARMRVLIDPETMATRPAAGPILVRHLMTHTSGLSYAINGDGALPRLYREHGIEPGDILRGPQSILPRTLDEFGARLAALPLGADPGARIEYSVGLDVLGLVIQRAAATPFDQFLHDRLFAPLGMVDTGFFAPAEKLARLSTNYRVTPEGPRAIDAPPDTPYADPHVMPSGGAGLVSSARDYIRFCTMLLNEGAFEGAPIMPADMVRLARSHLGPPGLYLPTGEALGAGMRIIRPGTEREGDLPAGAASWGGAAGTTMWFDPARRFALVLMTQFMPQNAYPLWEEIRRAAYADLA